jgi:tRNA A37 threonylcarbamoyladenosine dehydratase
LYSLSLLSTLYSLLSLLSTLYSLSLSLSLCVCVCVVGVGVVGLGNWSKVYESVILYFRLGCRVLGLVHMTDVSWNAGNQELISLPSGERLCGSGC